jgi:hypothetical protein
VANQCSWRFRAATLLFSHPENTAFKPFFAAIFSVSAEWHDHCNCHEERLPAKGVRGCKKDSSKYKSRSQIMNNRLFWAFLWVIGLPLPLVIILYMLFGHHG